MQEEENRNAEKWLSGRRKQSFLPPYLTKDYLWPLPAFLLAIICLMVTENEEQSVKLIASWIFFGSFYWLQCIPIVTRIIRFMIENKAVLGMWSALAREPKENEISCIMALVKYGWLIVLYFVTIRSFFA